MVCHLTIGKKKYADVEETMKAILKESEELRSRFTLLIDKDTEAFNKVMEAFTLPRDSEAQRSLREAAIASATKEATLIPLEVMKHCIDGLALALKVARNGNKNSVSDAGVSALMLQAACESAALNVKINLNALTDMEFVHWKRDEAESILRTARTMAEEVHTIVDQALTKS